MEAWGGRKADGDAPDAGHLGFLTWWFAGAEGRKQLGNPLRMQDQLTFIAEVQRDYYAGMKHWLKEDIGCRQLVLTSNFRPAVPETMQDLENWVKASGDVITQNYFGFGDQGDGFPIQKWNSSEPGHLAGYPAAALIARRGYGVQTRPAVLERRTFADIISLEPPLLPEGLDYDPLYEAIEQGSATSAAASDLPPEAFLMGPVLVEFTTGEAEIDPKVSASDPANPVIESLDGSIRTDRKTGLVTLDTPSAQAAVGFLGAAGPVRLTDLIVESANVHLSVAVVALDERPLADSGKILVQVTPRVRPTGWKVEAATREDKKSKKTLAGWEITSTGSLPFRIENISGELTLRNAGIERATALDGMGRPLPEKTVELTRTGGSVVLTLPEDALWILLE